MKILIFCAHPDDLEFIIPSFILTTSQFVPEFLNNKEKIKLKELNKEALKYIFKNPNIDLLDLKIKIASMTRGEMSFFTDEIKSTLKAAKIRENELIKSQKVLSGKIPDFLGFFDGFIRASDFAIEKIKNYINALKPDIVIAPEPLFAWYHHPDHVRTGKIVFYAIRRLAKLKNVTIPKLFYFQSLLNDFYFPRFSFHKKIIKKALKFHRSQQKVLLPARIPGFFENLFHGLKIPYHIFGEALRYQPIFPKYKEENEKIHNNQKIRKIKIHKNILNLNLFKRMIYYCTFKIFNSFTLNDYNKRYKYFDGKLNEKINLTW